MPAFPIHLQFPESASVVQLFLPRLPYYLSQQLKRQEYCRILSADVPRFPVLFQYIPGCHLRSASSAVVVKYRKVHKGAHQCPLKYVTEIPFLPDLPSVLHPVLFPVPVPLVF